MDTTETEQLPWWAWTGALTAVAAVVLELARVPLAWPNPVRAGWWALATLGVAAWHVGRHRAGEPVGRVVATLTVLAFAAFTVGVVIGAEWAAWH